MAEVRLSEFLGELARRRFDWANSDCFTICADWVLRATGRDPAAPYRGCHPSKAQTRRLARDAGGDVALATRAMESIGLRLVQDDPRPGDVALVLCPTADGASAPVRREVGGICVADGVFAVLTSDRGLVIAPMQWTKAWAVTNG